jgi:hypothetical protein
MIKSFVSSKWTRIVFSLVLIYFAFRRVDVLQIFSEVTRVPWWFVLLMLVYSAFTSFLGGVRWSLLIIDKPKINDFFLFTRSTYLGGFYGLIFPTMVAGDILKWVPLLKHYPELTKTKLATSVLLDRVIGLAAFVVVGFMALVAGKWLGYQFPNILLWLFSGLLVGMVCFFVMVLYFDFDKVFGKFVFLRKPLEVVNIVKQGNKKRMWNCFWISLLAEPIWMLPVYLYSLVFNAGISLLQVYIFIPVIALILVLPISVAGFGARGTCLYFLALLGIVPENTTCFDIWGIITYEAC